MGSRILQSTSDPQRRDAAGFTRTELCVVLATLALLAAAVLPVLAQARPDSRIFQCLNNHRRFMQAWSLYAADFGDRVPNNFTVTDALGAINSGRLDNWANNVMAFTDTSSPTWQSVTNVYWVTNGVFGKYTGPSVDVYRCPSDTYLSALQRARGVTRRNRSYSMNGMVGRTDRLPGSASGRSWYDSAYRQFLKTTDFPNAAGTWVTIEEHADSINEGFFINQINTTAWQDIPAAYHNGACSFSFADGHTEQRKWLSTTSKYPVTAGSYPNVRPFDPAGRLDFQWYKDRTGFVLVQ
jgi:prepilin-type processing-associated H-X9-DG protein